MRKRTPTIATKLAAIDHIEFEQFCRLEGKTKTEIAREAILFYLKSKKLSNIDEHEREVLKYLHKMDKRFSALLVKLGIGIYGTEYLLWTRTDSDKRAKLFSDSYISGVQKMRAKLKDNEQELRQLLWE